MFSTWDSYRNELAVWRSERNDARHYETPLSHFLVTVDRLFYAATIAFAVCVTVLVFG